MKTICRKRESGGKEKLFSYKIDGRTWLLLPKWKHRPEFAEYHKAWRETPDDVDRLAELKAACDRVAATHRRKCEASRRTAIEQWARPGMRDRVDTSQAKPVDVFDMQGRYVATYPSSRKAAEGLGFGDTYTAERGIRNCRSGNRLSYRGFRVRDHEDGVTDIGPYTRPPKKPKRRGWHKYQPGKPVVVTYPDGGTRRFIRLKECAEELGVTYNTLWKAMKANRPLKTGERVEFES